MSFMFKPLAYDDPHAVNHPHLAQSAIDDLTFGTVAAAARLAKELAARSKNGGVVVAIDGYASAQFDDLCGALAQNLRQRGVAVVRHAMDEVYKTVAQLDEMLQESLPLNYDEDPVLLFGRLFEGSFAEFFDAQKLAALQGALAAVPAGTVVLLSGFGSTSAPLQNVVQVCIYLDVTPKTAAIRAREGRLINVGDQTPRPFKELMRRNYYVDFEIILKNRKALLNSDRLAYYIAADHDADFILMTGNTMAAILGTLVQYPFRTKPVYLEGIWGGEFIRKARHLPMEYKNIAWVFDMIPMEVSVVVDAAGKLVEFPFFTFIQKCAAQMMGAQCVKSFKGYFPIRFNYDDTYHSDGNMSVQVHPERSLCTRMYGEKGSQDEAYYVIATAHGAKTFVGFRAGQDPQEFIGLIKQSEQGGGDVDYMKYVNYLDSAPGRQVMLPGGTIHASGRGQLILELGSLTIGSYTYKMYDYNRVDTDGNRRPIHSAMGERALHTERDTGWVRENIAFDPIPDGQGEGWQQFILGKTDLMYYMTKNVFMDTHAKAEFSNNGQFTVLTLVDGENVRVYSKSNPDFYYDQKFLDIVVVPASITDYVIENTGYQPCVVHKTMLKEGYEAQFGIEGEEE